MLSLDSKELEEQLLSLVNAYSNAFEKGVEKFAVDATALFVDATPYGNTEKYYNFYVERYKEYGFEIRPGLAKGSWSVTTGSFYSLGAIDYDQRNGYKSKIRAKATAQEYVLGEDIYITNSVPYIGKLQNGYSRQLPTGFRPTVDQVVALYNTDWKKYFRVKKQKNGTFTYSTGI
jgi:hypothetical protein